MPEDDAEAGADLDAEVVQRADQQHAEDRPDGPPQVVGQAEVGGHRAAQDAAEQDADQRDDQRVGEVEAPAGQEAELGSQAARDVGVHAARGGQVLGELPDGQGGEQAADQRDDHAVDSAPPANSAPTVMENAAPAAGAIVVTDVKITSGSPTALRAQRFGRVIGDLFGSHFALDPCGDAADATAGLRGALRPLCAVGLLYGPLGRSIRTAAEQCQEPGGPRAWASGREQGSGGRRPRGRDPEQVGPGELDVRGDMALGRVRIAVL